MNKLSTTQLDHNKFNKKRTDEEFYAPHKYDADEHIKRNITYSGDTLKDSNNYSTFLTML